MWGILKDLVRIAKEVKRIREVLEIAYHHELSLHEYAKGYSKTPLKPSDVEFNVTGSILDEYGEEIIEEDGQEN